MADTTNNQQQVHSDAVQEIIGTPPSWLTQWGITIFLGILLLILSLTAFISYPDVVKTQLKIRSLQLPATISAGQKGVISKLLVQNNDEVKPQQILAIISSVNGYDTLKATIGGTLNYLGIIHQGEELNVGRQLFTINPANANYYGELAIPPGGMAKVQAGQQVIIKLKNYPYQEYGLLKGTIKYLTEDPRGNGAYLAEVELADTRYTDVHKPVTLKPAMIADAEVITQNSTLLKRLTENLFRNMSQWN